MIQTKDLNEGDLGLTRAIDELYVALLCARHPDPTKLAPFCIKSDPIVW
jgi:hypothetical protein